MTFDTLLLLIVALGFVLVSLALAFKFFIEAYLDYVQVKMGITVVTSKMLEEAEGELEEDEDDLR